MNKTIESVADYFKDKYNNTPLIVSTFGVDGYYGAIQFRYELLNMIPLIGCIYIWFKSNNVDLYLYSNNRLDNLNDYRWWDINDPKCIIEIEKCIDRHIEKLI